LGEEIKSVTLVSPEEFFGGAGGEAREMTLEMGGAEDHP
jgi:hypothetical protein